MSNETPGPAFWERANALINMANEQCSSAQASEVSASILYASARFNAFIVAKDTGNAQNLKLERQRALDYFTDQFRKMLEVNLDDFVDDFERLMGQGKR